MLQVSEQMIFVYLKATIPLIQESLKRRVGHFMNPKLIQSQFDTLEEPKEALEIDAGLTPAQIVEVIRNRLSV
jgi:gluconate kinase